MYYAKGPRLVSQVTLFATDAPESPTLLGCSQLYRLNIPQYSACIVYAIPVGSKHK